MCSVQPHGIREVEFVASSSTWLSASTFFHQGAFTRWCKACNLLPRELSLSLYIYKFSSLQLVDIGLYWLIAKYFALYPSPWPCSLTNTAGQQHGPTPWPSPWPLLLALPHHALTMPCVASSRRSSRAMSQANFLASPSTAQCTGRSPPPPQAVHHCEESLFNYVIENFCTRHSISSVCNLSSVHEKSQNSWCVCRNIVSASFKIL